MKTINKITFFIFTCLTLSSVPAFGFYYSEDPGANIFGNAATGAAIGGIAGGGRGAAIGAGVGLGLGAMSSAATRDRRRYYDRDYYPPYDDYYYEDYRPIKRRRYYDDRYRPKYRRYVNYY